MSTQPFDPGPLADVSAERADPGWTLVFVRELRHAPERVWRALTDPSEVSAWAPYTSDRDLGQLGEAKLTMIDTDDGADGMVLSATIDRADAPTLLEYTWGEDRLRWELEPTDRGTRLTLRHTVADREQMPMVAAGWHLCLVVAERLLDGDPVPPIRGEAAKEFGWEDLNRAYAKELGVDPSN
jgi:uncharacterized protein YndB with AHSA1/START domain